MSKSVKDALFNPDYHNEGYGIGLEQGKGNKDKNRMEALKALHPVNHLIHTDHARETLNAGQDKGYIDGKRVQNNIFGGKQPGASKVQCYQYHVNLLEEAREDANKSPI